LLSTILAFSGERGREPEGRPVRSSDCNGGLVLLCHKAS